jgi:glycine cleavage system T protein (aminomethyltransferase)
MPLAAADIDPEPETRKTGFYDSCLAEGGSFVEFRGWWLPAEFSGVEEEYWALRRSAGMSDPAALPKWRVSGPEAGRCVDWLCTSPLSAIEVGQARYSPVCDEDGKMTTDLVAFRLGADEYWLMPTVEFDADLVARLRDLWEVELENVIERLDTLQVQGPLSRRIVGSVCGEEAARLHFYRFLPEPIEIAGAEAWISRTGYSGEIGYEIFCAPEDGPAIWRAFREADGVVPNGFRAIATLRVEAGLVSPLETPPGKRSPYEASLDRFVRFDGRDFCGREALLRARDEERRGLATLRFDDGLPERGAVVRAASAVVGEVTSPCRSPGFGSIALAVIDRDAAVEGARVEVETEDGPLAGYVAPTPISDPERRRPRG